MQPHDHLLLREVRLSPGEEWSCMGDELRLIVPHSGMAVFQHDQVGHPLGAGDALAVHTTPAAPSTLQASPGAGFNFATFSLRLSSLFPVLDAHELAILPTVADALRTPSIHSGSSPVAVHCHRLLAELPPGLGLERRSGFLRIAAALIAGEFERARSRQPGFGLRLKHDVQQVFDTLSVEAIMDESVKQVATRFNCGDRQLNRLFHRHFGLSFTALRMEMRLLKARYLVREGGGRIADVAAQCGFNQVSLFSRCFKRRFGLSPGRWRNQPPGTSGSSSVAGAHLGHASNCPIHRVGLCPLPGQEAAPPAWSHPAAPGSDTGLRRPSEITG